MNKLKVFTENELNVTLFDEEEVRTNQDETGNDERPLIRINSGNSNKNHYNHSHSHHHHHHTITSGFT